MAMELYEEKMLLAESLLSWVATERVSMDKAPDKRQQTKSVVELVGSERFSLSQH